MGNLITMGDLIGFLVIGTLFFFMMRWGCGAGHGHGRRGHNHESGDSGNHGQNKHKSGGCH